MRVIYLANSVFASYASASHSLKSLLYSLILFLKVAGKKKEGRSCRKRKKEEGLKKNTLKTSEMNCIYKNSRNKQDKENKQTWKKEKDRNKNC